jgi:signal peptidase II
VTNFRASAKRLAAPALLAVAILVSDRLSKAWVAKNISVWDVWPVIPGYVNIIHTENPGMAFSLLSTASPTIRGLVLIGLAGVVLVVVTLMFWRTTSAPERWALSLVLGGATGNLWDRITRGAVTDFIDFYIGEWHWATFNVADSAITVGAILLALSMLIPTKEQPRVS